MPHFDAGGAERVVLMLLQHLDRSRFAPLLVLQGRRGAFLDAVPADVPIHDLGGRSSHRSLPALIHLLQRNRVEVAYTATNAVNLLALAASLVIRPRISLVVSEHAPIESYLRQAKWRTLRVALIRMLYGYAAALAVPTQGIAEEMRRLLRSPRAPIVVLSNPLVDLSRQVEPKLPPEIEAADCPVFVGAGRLVDVKAFDLLIEAFAALRRRHPSAHLLLVGDGPKRASLEALANSLGQRGHVQLIGFRSRLADYMRHATAFVLTSRWEGFGNVLIEAMAAGAPVISVDCPVGPRDILEGGEAGMLVERRDPEAIALAMAAMIEDPERRARLLMRGHRRARSFDVATTVPAFEALFEEIARHQPDLAFAQ
jgi:glycosyltransferase involved in cell wall biosynthesis